MLFLVVIPVTARGSGLRQATSELPDRIRGIRIHYQYNREAVFPKSWLEAPIHCMGAQVERSEAERTVPVIEEFASAYDDFVLREHLTDIYVLGDLQCYDQPYGGTNSTSALYLRVGTERQGYDAPHLLSILHAEFSSILLRNHAFPGEEWTALNPASFQYNNNAIQVLDEAGITDRPPEALFCGGFLSRYATSDVEDDFNEYAGWIFTRTDELCRARSECPAIEAKTQLALRFYKSVDPNMALPECGS